MIKIAIVTSCLDEARLSDEVLSEHFDTAFVDLVEAPYIKGYDYIHLPDFDGFDVFGPQFAHHNYGVELIKPLKFKPISHEVLFFYEKVLPLLLEKNKKVLMFGHAFYRALAMYKRGEHQLRFPLTVREGQIQLKNEAEYPLMPRDFFHYLSDERMTGFTTTTAFLNQEMVEIIHQGVEKTKTYSLPLEA